MIPLSYTGFGTAAILLMVMLAGAGQVLQSLKNHRSGRRHIRE